MDEPQLFVDLGLLLLAALGGGLLAQVLRQPLIVGYVLAGILVGPFTPGPTVSDPRSFRLFAEIGVILLMFSIGVDFSIGELLRVRRVALQGALARVARTRNTELFLLVVVVVAIGTAALTASLGLSLALGAFLAGLVISESQFAHETL